MEEAAYYATVLLYRLLVRSSQGRASVRIWFWPREWPTAKKCAFSFLLRTLQHRFKVVVTTTLLLAFIVSYNLEGPHQSVSCKGFHPATYTRVLSWLVLLLFKTPTYTNMHVCVTSLLNYQTPFPSLSSPSLSSPSLFLSPFSLPFPSSLPPFSLFSLPSPLDP